MTTTCRRCGATWHGLRLEHCTVCHQTFTGTSAGDAHRVGAHGPARRCLTVDEMTAAGMTQNARGYWQRGAKGVKDPSKVRSNPWASVSASQPPDALGDTPGSDRAAAGIARAAHYVRMDA